MASLFSTYDIIWITSYFVNKDFTVIAAQAPFSYSLRTRRVRTKGAILSRERMAPFRSPKRTRGEDPSTPDIGSLELEELHALRNAGAVYMASP